MSYDSKVKLLAKPLKEVSRLNNWLLSSLHLTQSFKSEETHQIQPGEAPGIENMEGVSERPASGTVHVYWCDYSDDRIEWKDGSVEEFEATPRPDWATQRWVNIDGLHPYVINEFRQKYNFHTLVAEDIMRTSQRPKVELHDDYAFTVLRMMQIEDAQLKQEQVSLLLFDDCLLTFQEIPGDVWGPIRKRLEKPNTRIRRYGVSYLYYALLDAVVDNFFPILETYGERLEELEEAVLHDPGPSVQRDIHGIKRELSGLRRVMWPIREVANQLQHTELKWIDSRVVDYLRDVYDHSLQIIEIVEMHREQAASLNDLYMSAVGNRMNEIMKVLTIMASFFIPITFVAGVYGMNFEYIPELSWHGSYFVFWGVCSSMVTGLALYFWHRGWIGKR